MALNPSVFKTRSLTAAVFVVVMLTGLLWNPWSFFLLFTVIHFGCWIEYRKIIVLIDREYATISALHRYSVPIAGWCLMLYCIRQDLSIAGISLHVAGKWGCLVFLCLLVLGETIRFRTLSVRNILHSAFGLLYISVPLAMLVWLRSIYYESGVPFADRILVLMIIGSIWINDTMAYIVGSLIGKTPLSRISPKKTWEGTIGGIILAIAVMGLLARWLRSEPAVALFPATDWMIVAAIASIVGTFGDLLESKLKRMAGVKDSGHIMPGHGGFLDRFDSLLIATPFAWAYLVWVVGVGS
ncbi:MAG TPA: phosphatidate cytidylyltransferase [Puia sp.]|jgi:phosphatidate cytidylyltransferase|nr:phosphatidate cytidylyltransferase [Puia sp.]